MGKTPVEKWNDKIASIRSTCQAILEVSDDIRYAGVINEYGRTMAGILRPGVTPILDSKQTRDEFFIVASMLRMRRELVRSVGNLDHITMQYNQIYIVVLQHEGLYYYLSVDVNVENISKLILRVKESIQAGVNP